MELIPPEIADLGTLRRILFATTYLPKDLPEYWSVITVFAKGETTSTNKIKPDIVKTMVENLQLLSPTVFNTDKEMMSEIHTLCPSSSHPLGIVLISPKTQCQMCGGKLATRRDRPSHLTVYTESFGTLVGTHYHKYCQNCHKGCSFRQFYGYHSEGSQSVMIYDQDWASYTCFVSSSETAFEMKLLTRFDAELLLGQISYNQKADIYNCINGYAVAPKKCCAQEKEDKPRSTKRLTILLECYSIR